MMKNAVAVLYFGGTRLSCVIGRPSINNSFVTLGRADAEYSGIVGGEVVDPEELAAVLQVTISKALKSTTAKIHKLYVGAPPQFCDCSVHVGSAEFDKPRSITQRDIKAMFNSVAYTRTGETIINEGAIWYKLDGGRPIINAIGLTAQSIQAKFSVISVADSFITLVRACLRGTPFKTVAFISAALAKALYLVDEESRDKTCVLISSGMFSTSVCVIVGDGVVFLKSFNTGIAHVINDVSVVLGIDFHIANLLVDEAVLSVRMNDKDNYEVINNNKRMKFSAATVNDIIKSRLEVMGENIKKLINMADPNLISKPIFICGGHLDAVAGARDFFSKAIGAQITQCVCPFTKQNKPSEITIQALLNLAIKQEK